MKKLLLMIGIAAIVFTGCKPEEEIDKTDDTQQGNGLEVAEKQRSLLVYYTATWCGPCGAYGSPSFKTLTQNFGYDDLSMIDMHTSNSQLVPFWKKPGTDSFFVSPVNQILANLPLPGTVPAFFLNGKYEGTTVPLSTANSKVGAANAGTPTVGVAAKATADGSKITLDTKVKFFADADGTYSLSAILVEKDVNFRQAVGSAYQEDFDHKFIAKASLIGGSLHEQEAYSDAIASGSISMDHTVEGEYIFTHEDIGSPNQNFPAWDFDKTNSAVVVIVWKDKIGGEKTAVNSIMIDVQ